MFNWCFGAQFVEDDIANAQNVILRFLAILISPKSTLKFQYISL